MKWKSTTEQQKKKEMIEFLKCILPYWKSDDLDDYMYIVHHYDLERVATKIQEVIDEALIQQKQEFEKKLNKLRKEIDKEINSVEFYGLDDPRRVAYINALKFTLEKL